MLVSIWEWERHWVPDHAERLPGMRHTACGADFAPLLTCRSCGETVSEKDVVAQWGPSGSWPRSMPVAVDPATIEADQRDAAAGLFPQTMSVLGNRWAFALLVAAFVGMSRFTDFQTQLGAPPGSIADRLSIFTANGVLVVGRQPIPAHREGPGLLPGADLRAAVGAAVVPRARRPGGDRSRTRRCGRRFTAVLACDQCARPLTGAHIEAVLT